MYGVGLGLIFYLLGVTSNFLEVRVSSYLLGVRGGVDDWNDGGDYYSVDYNSGYGGDNDIHDGDGLIEIF